MYFKTIKDWASLLWGLFFFSQLVSSELTVSNDLPSEPEYQQYCIQDTTTEWSVFKEKYKFQNVYLVFAGPYPTSPSSSFGHLFLLLEPLESFNTPILLWSSVNFSADIENENSISKFYKGIFGGLIGQYQITPFYDKLRDYTFIESRDLWIFPINLSQSEIDQLQYNLFKVSTLNYHYRFHDNNCASQIETLILSSFSNKKISSKVIVSPRSVIMNLSDKLMKPFLVSSMESSLKEYSIQANINSQLKDLDNAIDNIPDPEAAILLSILEWRYFHKGVLLNDYEKQYLNKLRIKVSKLKATGDIDLRNYKKSFNMHPPVKFGMGLQYDDMNTEIFLFHFRLGLHEFSDNTDVFPKHDFMSIGKITIGFNKRKLVLNEFWLFDQQSTTPRTFLSSSISWRLGFGAVRNIHKEDDKLSTGLFVGIGKTYSWLNEAATTSFMLNINPLLKDKDGVKIIINPQSLLQVYKFKYTKINIEVGSFRGITNKSTWINYIRSDLIVDITQGYQIAFSANGTKGKEQYSIYLYKYMN